MSRGPAVVAALGLTVVVALGPLAALASPGRGGPRNGPGVSASTTPVSAPILLRWPQRDRGAKGRRTWHMSASVVERS